MNFVWKANEGEAKGIVLLIFALWQYFTCWWVRASGVLQKVLLRASWNLNTSYSRQDFSQCNKHYTFWHVAWPGYFYILFLWAIAYSDFWPLEIHKNLGLPLPSITFPVISLADNHFYKHIYSFQILYSMKSVFLLKYMLRLFILYILYFYISCCTHGVTCNMGRWNNGGNGIYKKVQ